MPELVGLLVVAVVILLGIRFGTRIRQAVGVGRRSRDRRAGRDRRRVALRVPLDRRKGLRRQDELADDFVKQLRRSAGSSAQRTGVG